MNPYIRNLNRIEFVITLACTGKCKHCSEGTHGRIGAHIDGAAAAEMVRRVAEQRPIASLMTFGGEPLLFPDEVYAIHTAAREAGIEARQLITNGFFSQNEERIKSVVQKLAESGVNDLLLSVDAFHQEAIPLEPVLLFAKEVYQQGGIRIQVHPAWLVSKDDNNPYNIRTRELLEMFYALGLQASSGNVIFPSGNALKYLRSYFDGKDPVMNPYAEDPQDIRALCVTPEGNVLGGNIYRQDILAILEGYLPQKGRF